MTSINIHAECFAPYLYENILADFFGRNIKFQIGCRRIIEIILQCKSGFIRIGATAICRILHIYRSTTSQHQFGYSLSLRIRIRLTRVVLKNQAPIKRVLREVISHGSRTASIAACTRTTGWVLIIAHHLRHSCSYTPRYRTTFVVEHRALAVIWFALIVFNITQKRTYRVSRGGCAIDTNEHIIHLFACFYSAHSLIVKAEERGHLAGLLRTTAIVKST